MDATGDEPTDEKMSPERIRMDIEELLARPGGHNDKVRELLSIVERLEAMSIALAASDSDRSEYARGWLNGVIQSLSQLADLAKGNMVTLD